MTGYAKIKCVLADFSYNTDIYRENGVCKKCYCVIEKIIKRESELKELRSKVENSGVCTFSPHFLIFGTKKVGKNVGETCKQSQR